MVEKRGIEIKVVEEWGGGGRKHERNQESDDEDTTKEKAAITKANWREHCVFNSKL